MNLEQSYVTFNFPASSTFSKLLKNEDLKYTKNEIDDFISQKSEQQQTTIKTEKKKRFRKISFILSIIINSDGYIRFG